MNEQIFKLIEAEKNRQINNIELIASENFVSSDVLKAQGSILTNKYAEGYPNARYYGGCEYVDQIEQLAIDRARDLFGAEHINVQPHSGSQANIAVLLSVLKPNDKVLGLKLDHGGHLTHGHPLNFSGIMYDFIGYGLKDDETIDYEELARLAEAEKPKMILAGASAYSREIDFKKISDIAKANDAYLFVDMAHIAGLVAAGLHQSPIPYADFVTCTTHKTLRGPRGGIIMCRQKYAKAIDRAIFPTTQGGPLMHVIAAKAVAFEEAKSLEYKNYMQQVIKNAQAMANQFQKYNLKVISNGTDNHLFLIDVTSLNLTGHEAQQILEKVNITTNKNTIPNDPKSPQVTSGIRIGTPAVTTRGLKENDVAYIVDLIHAALINHKDEAELKAIAEKVQTFIKAFPLFDESTRSGGNQ